MGNDLYNNKVLSDKHCGLVIVQKKRFEKWNLVLTNAHTIWQLETDCQRMQLWLFVNVKSEMWSDLAWDWRLLVGVVITFSQTLIIHEQDTKEIVLNVQLSCWISL